MNPIDVRNVKFGMDAEFFLKTLAGHPVPVCGLLGGTKEEPKPLEELGEGFAVQEDNAAAEFNIPATPSIIVFRNHVGDALQAIRTRLPETMIPDTENSCVLFSEKYLRIPQLQVFGCDPDYNAYSMTTNERPVAPQPGLRTAAAHIHSSWNDPTDEQRFELIRLFDVFAVLPIIKDQTDADARRRSMYGKAGAFRPKKYGVEHRVLSNTWIFNPTKIRETLRRYVDAIVAFNAGITVDPKDYSKVENAINNPHKKLAVMLHEMYKRKFQHAVGPMWSMSDYYANFEGFGSPRKSASKQPWDGLHAIADVLAQAAPAPNLNNNF